MFAKNLRFFVLFGLLALQPGAPIPVRADTRSINADTTIYIPAVFKSGGLANGGTYVGEGGVGLGALANSLAGPVEVNISKTAAPTLALPPRAQVVSDFYQVIAGADVAISTDSPLILAFPAPAGADTASLALAWLPSSPQVADTDAATPAWTFLEGKYDPNQNLFLTTLSALSQAGDTLALVDHPDFASPTNTAPAAPTGVDSPNLIQFIVHCVNFTNTTDCTPATETTVADYLSQIYARIQGTLLFHDPRLRFLDETLNYNPNSLSVLGYTAYIEPFDSGYCQTASAGGYYDPPVGRLVLCLNPAVGLNFDYVHILIHEYFHATQYGYPVVFTERLLGLDEKWGIEGMAKTSEESFFVDSMLRSTIGGWVQLHKADVTLKSTGGFDEYFAQDFWVYYGQHTGQGLEYLKQVLTGGVQATDVARTIGSGDLLDPYWDFIKNQLEEPVIDYGGVISTPCQLELPLLNTLERFDYTWNPMPWHDVTLGPLTSIVVDVRWDFHYNFAFGNVFAPLGQPAGANLALRFKFYEEGETGCESVPDGPRIYTNPDPGKRYYVVISNIDPTQTYVYRVGFEVAPIPAP